MDYKTRKKLRALRGKMLYMLIILAEEIDKYNEQGDNVSEGYIEANKNFDTCLAKLRTLNRLKEGSPLATFLKDIEE